LHIPGLVGVVLPAGPEGVARAWLAWKRGQR